jgi:hypothetical protein
VGGLMKCEKCDRELSENWRKEETHEGILIDGYCDNDKCQFYGKIVAMRRPEYKEIIEKNG